MTMDTPRLAADLRAQLLAVPTRKHGQNSSTNDIDDNNNTDNPSSIRSSSELDIDYTYFDVNSPYVDCPETTGDFMLQPDSARGTSHVDQRRPSHHASHSTDQEEGSNTTYVQEAASNPPSQRSSISFKQNQRRDNHQQDGDKKRPITSNNIAANHRSNQAVAQQQNDRKNSMAVPSNARTSSIMSNASRFTSLYDLRQPRPSVASMKMSRMSLYTGCDNSPDYCPPLRSKALSDIIGRLNMIIVFIIIILSVMISLISVTCWSMTSMLRHVTKDDHIQYPADNRASITKSPLNPTSARDCLDVMHLGYHESGVYDVSVDGSNITSVYCDMETAGGGWTVLMRRRDNSVGFNKSWDDYKNGFGDKMGEFWAGNELMHRLTAGDRKYTLRVDMTSFGLSQLYAEYTDFFIAPVTDYYRIYVGGYSGTAGDSLLYHNACRFSTAEIDNDYSTSNCAAVFGAPWWFNVCHRVFLTGKYGSYPGVGDNRGIVWRVPWGTRIFAKYVDMKIKPQL